MKCYSRIDSAVNLCTYNESLFFVVLESIIIDSQVLWNVRPQNLILSSNRHLNFFKVETAYTVECQVHTSTLIAWWMWNLTISHTKVKYVFRVMCAYHSQLKVDYYQNVDDMSVRFFVYSSNFFFKLVLVYAHIFIISIISISK